MKLCFFAVIAAVVLAPISALSLDDAKVRTWAIAGLKGASQEVSSVPENELNQRFDLDTVREGWQRLKVCRDSGQSTNLELAAAEHYLFARLIAGNDGDTEYRDFPKFYESLKSWASRVELESYLQTSSEPVSPVSADVTSWGKAGVDAGLEDYEVRTGEKPSNKWGSYAKAITVSYAYYYKYLPQTASCSISIR